MSCNCNCGRLSDRKRTIGIVGGMGPESGLYLCNQIMSLTEANSDQDHSSLILMSLPQMINDRSAFLTGKCRKNPAIEIAKIIEKLERAGADIVGICCNTAHSPEIFDVVMNILVGKDSKVNVLHMPAETCNELHNILPQNRRVGLMSTNGTMQSGIYETLLRNMGYDPVLPDRRLQNDIIHRSVYDPVIGIKANAGKSLNAARDLLEEAFMFFEERQAHTIILGCTEFSLLNMQSRNGTHFIDSSRAFAKALLREVNYTCRAY